MPADLAAPLLRQFSTASKLLHYHLDTLSTQACLWRPTPDCLHVREDAGGRWIADLPEREDYDIGPPSLAWLTWHLGYCLSMVIDHAFGEGRLSREEVDWPGEAGAVRAWIYGLEDTWRAHLEGLSAAEFASSARTRWPYTDRPFVDVAAWATVELVKNAAEIGYARFAYAVRPDR